MFPPTSPDAGLLAATRAALAAADFTEPVVRERAALRTIHDFPLGRLPADGTPPQDAAGALIRLFMEGSALPAERVQALLGRELTEALLALELLACDRHDQDAFLAPVALYPVEGLYIASDRGEEFPIGRPDAVFPGISPTQPAYLAAIARTPCESVLEVCSGTGIGALLAAGSAHHVWASDITERSTAFARFNAALNGVSNFTAVQGDMYGALPGQRFERILAHPPYVPALRLREIYRDGGADGEELTRRVIAEAPDHLLPGGCLYCSCMLTDREQEPMEVRVRRMLGPAAPDFDVLVMPSGALPPIVHFTRELALGHCTLEDAAQLVKTFEGLGIAHFCPCTIVLRRHEAAAPPLTLRRERSGTRDVTAAAAALLRWEGFSTQPAALERLAQARPRLSSRARLQVGHVPADGGWKADEYRVVVGEPLPTQLNASPNAAVFVAWCDGAHTVRELAERLMAEGLAPPQEPVPALAAMVLGLLKEGVLEAELPPA